MQKEKFDILESTCVPLPLENIDTDQIIPARFLSTTSREGFGDNLFSDWFGQLPVSDSGLLFQVSLQIYSGTMLSTTDFFRLLFLKNIFTVF
jgi:3-isopropylmalate dehydratase small subunit